MWERTIPPMLPSYLVAASALVVFVLGAMHLFYTFSGPAFDPRDPELKLRLQEVSPRLTSQTTMWRAWVGFNASHSFGALLFGWVYGYLALAQAEMFFSSKFLVLTGAVLLAGYVALARAYWFSIPSRGVTLAAVLYALGMVVRFA